MELLFNPTATDIYTKLVLDIEQAMKDKDIKKLAMLINNINNSKNKTTELIAAGRKLRSSGLMTKAYLMRDQLNKKSNMYENSGYIPSDSEKNDPRFKTALSVDVNPYSIQKNAKAFGWDISRAGIPPMLRKKRSMYA